MYIIEEICRSCSERNPQTLKIADDEKVSDKIGPVQRVTTLYYIIYTTNFEAEIIMVRSTADESPSIRQAHTVRAKILSFFSSLHIGLDFSGQLI